MSKGIVRLGDNTSGHDSYPLTTAIESSNKVFVDGIGINRLGDKWEIHCYNNCHQGITNDGSKKCFSDGISVGRINDPLSCNDTIISSSNKSFCL